MQCAVCGTKTQLSTYTFGDITKYLCRANNHVETHNFCSQGLECLPRVDFPFGSRVCRVHSLSNSSYDMMKSTLSTPTTPKQTGVTDPTLATKTSLDSINALVNTIKTQHNKFVLKIREAGAPVGITSYNYSDYLIQ